MAKFLTYSQSAHEDKVENQLSQNRRRFDGWILQLVFINSQSSPPQT